MVEMRMDVLQAEGRGERVESELARRRVVAGVCEGCRREGWGGVGACMGRACWGRGRMRYTAYKASDQSRGNGQRRRGCIRG